MDTFVWRSEHLTIYPEAFASEYRRVTDTACLFLEGTIANCDQDSVGVLLHEGTFSFIGRNVSIENMGFLYLVGVYSNSEGKELFTSAPWVCEVELPGGVTWMANFAPPNEDSEFVEANKWYSSNGYGRQAMELFTINCSAMLQQLRFRFKKGRVVENDGDFVFIPAVE